MIYFRSGSGLGIFGIGVLFGTMAAEQGSVIDAWLQRRWWIIPIRFRSVQSKRRCYTLPLMCRSKIRQSV